MTESTPTTPTPTRYLDPAALARLKNMGLAARLVVDGLFAGHHRSPRRGYSVEFAEHREYTLGDDPRHLDWKVLAKRDRLYIKQYEEQTSLRGYILLDASASMGYHHGGAMSKLEYAKYLAATLGQLMLAQHDAFGLIVCGDTVRADIPPRQGRSHMRLVLDQLENTDAQGETNLPRTFHDLAERLKRRALIIVLSDLFDCAGPTAHNPASTLLEALGHLRHRKHEAIVLQMLDPAELTFPFQNIGEIEDMETGNRITADAEALRRHYLDQLNDYLNRLRRGCLSREIGYALADTSEPFDVFLGTYLKRR
ncbi:MAG: DUF58 domain-containing protein, partial [Phycisphaeraceae bacterium]